MVSGIPNLGFDALTNGDCTTDFVVIANPSYVGGTPVNSDRFCGTSFNTVTSKCQIFVNLTMNSNMHQMLNMSIKYMPLSLSCRQWP